MQDRTTERGAYRARADHHSDDRLAGWPGLGITGKFGVFAVLMVQSTMTLPLAIRAQATSEQATDW
jgi:hypothetical protein